MGKYDGLSAFLRRWKLRNDADGVELSFAHIERLIGGYLPNGAADAAWWCAAELADRSAPHRRAWLEAGFDAVADTRSERVYFRRQASA